jgi:hypothetical protein
MDSDAFDQTDDLEPDDAAYEDDASEEPSDDDAPDDQDDVGDEDDGEQADDGDEEADDPIAERDRLRAELAARDKHERERADRDAQERLRQKQQADRQAEQQKHYARTQAWNTYQGEKAALAEQRRQDVAAILESGDPTRLAAELHQKRETEAYWIDYRYNQWVAQANAADLAQTQLALRTASAREYADYVRREYRLPPDAVDEIMAYMDGTPVPDSAYASRAYEIYERRKRDTNTKRQQTRQQREQARQQVRGRSGVSGRGRAPAVPDELEGSLEELRELFPMGRDLLRAGRRAS